MSKSSTPDLLSRSRVTLASTDLRPVGRLNLDLPVGPPCGIDDAAFLEEVHRLVCCHEVGGDPRSDLLVDADSLSYFDVNLPLYFARNSWEETQRRCVWGYRRLSERSLPLAVNLSYSDPELQRLVEASLVEVSVRP